MSGIIWLEEPILIDDVTCETIDSTQDDEDTVVYRGPLIKRLELDKIIRALAKNYCLKDEQVPELLAGFLAAGEDLRGLICASGYINAPAPVVTVPRKAGTLTEKAAQALAFMRAVNRPVTGQELASALYPEDSAQGIVREGAGSSAARDIRKAGYTVVGQWEKIASDTGKLCSVYTYSLREQEGA